MTASTTDQIFSTFSDLGVKPPFIEALMSMQITTPTEVQREAIPIALTGSDLIAIAQTGSGKTLAYALSVVTNLEKEPTARALILSPNRETAEQVYNVFLQICTGTSLSICLAATGTPLATQAKELKKNPRLIVGTPGRLQDHLANNKLLLQGLRILVIDEADRMLDLGFEEQLRFIQSTLRGERQTLMFAASFGSWAETVAKLFMRPDAVQVRSSAAGTPVATLSQKVFFLKSGQKQNRLLDEIKELKGGVIIFADSQESCVALGRLLSHHGFSSEFVHGKMNPGHRNRVLREFREEKIQIMVTTDLFARGLDVPTIRTVISYDLPYRGEEFIHRIGRTARAGRDGVAITFVTPADGRTYRRLKQYLSGAVETHLTDNFAFEERS
jgi:superfamily II DNA/RNA helicase